MLNPGLEPSDVPLLRISDPLHFGPDSAQINSQNLDVILQIGSQTDYIR
jgi:hypothetical protein